MTSATGDLPLVVVTPGEPAGIGPEVVLRMAQKPWPARLAVIADPQWLEHTAARLTIAVEIETISLTQANHAAAHQSGRLQVVPVPLAAPAVAGTLNAANAAYVLKTLDIAAEGCLQHRFDAMVTGPVHKGVINDSGVAFSGHTEYLAACAGGASTIMMLASETLRVVLVTTHIPLAKVSAAVTVERVLSTCRVAAGSLRDQFRIPRPRLLVLGLNPHAGESGHIGREEITVIEPAITALREEGIDAIGPMPADTAFTPHWLARCDAVIAMYHDQGLPVLKAQGFGETVNVTLGLPFIRTSVDHGTALDIAARGGADESSVCAAMALAVDLARQKRGSK